MSGYKQYLRKGSFKKDNSSSKIFMEKVKKFAPKVFLEIGVFQGVTARNVCDLLNKIHKKKFKYIGIDLFLSSSKNEFDSSFTPIHNRISNPFKNFYFNYILKIDLTSYEGVSRFLNKYKNNIDLHKGSSNSILKKINLKEVDFVFLDGGHSYEIVKNDLNILLNNLNKSKIIICDDYNQKLYGVKKAVDEIDKNKFKVSILNDRLVEIIT